MGAMSTGLSDALFTKTQRELERLTSVGLLVVEPVGNQKHYRANQQSPIFSELRSIALKTFGVTDVLLEVLAPLAKKIHLAFIYGSLAKGTDTTASDIDLMVVSDSLTYADVFGALEPATSALGRTVNPTVYARKKLAKRVKDDNAFVKRVLTQPKLWLIGSEHELSA